MARTDGKKRLTRDEKNAHQKRWFKDELDNLDRISFSNGSYFEFTSDGGNTGSEFRKMKINYDLFNNIINKRDFEHVCAPFGAEVGELPADFTNKDIISGKVKALIGMEMKRPFSWKVIATNEEATTRREQAEFGKHKDFVVNSIMEPIRTEIQQKYVQQQQGRELSPDEARKIQEQVAQELKAMTPPEVKKYMKREHQDPAEALSHQILEYLMQKEDIKMKFNKAWKHGLISGREIFWVGVVNGEPVLRVVNPIKFDYDKSPELDFIEDGEWGSYEMYMTPSEIISTFGSELSDVEIDEIYDDYAHGEALPSSFTFRDDGISSTTGTRVLHGEWKALKPFKFLTTQDPETGEIYEDIVDESYKLNVEAGDLEIQTEWIVTKYEGYKIGKDKYVHLREVPGQYKDLNNLHVCKLSFIGATYDNLNSEITSLIDRMKYYQYLYNILLYRIELLTASDKGKQMLLNLNMVPKNSGIDVEKWMYFFETAKIGWMDPNEEGNKGNTDISQAAKEIDMSLASDIQKYIQLAEYIEQRCGQSVGITSTIEGQTGNNQAVGNVQVELVQSANILEPYFELHNNIKRNVLQNLIEVAKVAYAEFQPAYLNYVLDDMSRMMIGMDYELLENSTYGIFVSNSMKSHEALQMVQQLSHAALQNQKVEMSDVIKVMRSESIQEAEELLKVAEEGRMEREQAQNQAQIEAAAQKEERDREFKREEWAHEIDKIETQEELKTDREIQKQLILSMGFNEDKDLDKDGVPDVLEVAKFGVDAEIKARKQNLDEAKQKHTEEVDKEKIKLEKQKLKKDANKKTTSK